MVKRAFSASLPVLFCLLLASFCMWVRAPGYAGADTPREVRIEATRFEYLAEKGYFEFTGDVYIEDDQNSIWGDYAFLDERKEKIRIKGNVRMRRNDADELEAEEVVFFYERDQFEAFGRVHYTSERLEAWAEYLHYDGRILSLEEEVLIVEGERSRMRGHKLTYDTEENVYTGTEGVEIEYSY